MTKAPETKTNADPKPGKQPHSAPVRPLTREEEQQRAEERGKLLLNKTKLYIRSIDINKL